VRNVTTGQPPEAGILGDDAVSFGSGLLGLIVRPSRCSAPRQVCEAQVARWTRQWPELSARL